MKVYISGKMKGLDKEDYEQNFDDAEKALKMQGHEVINPCKSIWNGDDHSHEGKKWGEMIRKDLELLSGCDAIYMLSNWKEDSQGCRVEYHFAKGLGIKILNANDDGPLEEFLRQYRQSGPAGNIQFMTTNDIAYMLEDMQEYTSELISMTLQAHGYRMKVIHDKYYWVMYNIN
jgi:hypothetical protein